MSPADKPTTPNIRPAAADDAEGITRVFMQSAEHHAGLDPDRYWQPSMESIAAQYRDRAQLMAADDDIVTLVADLDGMIVGFVDVRLHRSPDLMHRNLTYCHIAEIAVATDHQSHGVGGQLLTAAEDWGRHRGADLASLEFLAANTRASAFYQQRMGYRVAAMIAIKPLT